MPQPEDADDTPHGQSHQEQLEQLVRAIPAGKVAAYGTVGACCRPPLSGYFCGRLLGRTNGDMPWWRVVAKDGSLPVGRKNPELGRDARQMLAEEGVQLNESGKVHASCFVTSAELEAAAWSHLATSPEEA